MSIETNIRNKIKTYIKEQEELLDLYIKKNEKCRHNKDTAFLRNAIEKNNKYIDEIKNNLEKLQNKLENEQEICNEKNEIIINSQIIKDHNEKKEKIKYKIKKNDEIKKQKTYKNLKKQRRSENWDKKKFGRYYNKFLNNVDRLPKNIQENLENMPNNKGYIFRGIHFFGKNLPEKDEPVILFEKIYRKFYIHKYYEDKTQLYCKNNGKVQFVSETVHKKKFTTPSDWPKIKYANRNYRFNNRNSNNRNSNNRNNNNNNNNSSNRNNNDNSSNNGNNRFNKKRILNSWNN